MDYRLYYNVHRLVSLIFSIFGGSLDEVNFSERIVNLLEYINFIEINFNMDFKRKVGDTCQIYGL